MERSFGRNSVERSSVERNPERNSMEYSLANEIELVSDSESEEANRTLTMDQYLDRLG